MDRDNMIFDDVFRTLLEKTPRLAIPLINEVFGTAYDENTEITQLRNEHQTKDGRRITDSSLQIQDRIYHIECQSTQDSAMVIRMVEYDFYIALDHAILTEGKCRIEFPRTCVLYLRHDLNTKDELNLEIVFPHGEAVNYRVPVVKVQNYTKDVIFQKKLLFLLPFYVMRYEKEVERLEEDDEKLAELLEEYEEIRIRLENALGDGERRREYMELLEMIRKISDYIFRKSRKTKKGVSDRMGGQVLELEADKIYDRMEARYNAMVSAKEAEMRAKEAKISAKETEISAKETEISAKEAEMSAKEAKINAKETEISAKETEINAKETEISAKETEINAKETEISAKETEISAKEAEMSAKETKISAREEELKRRERESQVNRDKMLVHTLHFIAGFSPEKIADKMNYTLDKVTMLLEA